MAYRDPDDLREELRDYYGTAAMAGFPAAAATLFDLEDMDEDELEKLAEEQGLDRE